MKADVRYSECPVCRAGFTGWGRVRGFQLDQCTGCGYVFVNPRPGRAVLAEFYGSEGGQSGRGLAFSVERVLEGERSYPNSSLDAQRMVQRARGLMPQGTRFLDVGCGFGFFSREAARHGFQVEALEIGPFARDCARAVARVTPAAVAFEDFAPEGRTYDCILMSQVLEHVCDVNEWVGKAHSLLRPDGVLCVAVPNFGGLLSRALGKRDPYLVPPEHLNYFAPSTLRTLLEKHPFRMARMETVSRLPPDLFPRLTGRLPTPARRLWSLAVRHGQTVPFRLLNRTGLGMFINAYAVRR